MPLAHKHKESLVIVYTGEGKGKTSAGLGLVCRALGNGSRVAFIQFIKSWHVSEDRFLETVLPAFGDSLTMHKGGRGFYNAGRLSAKNVSPGEHRKSARQTYEFAAACGSSGSYDVVICDEINNAVHDGLLSVHDLRTLIDSRHKRTTLCLTGRNFPMLLSNSVDIMTNMTKIKHHFDDGYEANKGIDY
ncbi:MAG TPA: cob(I)yrinic acid a,c-diamide adenosyltransferase [Verrucomicrobiae bacterium]|nr:cob(I)yrinic acid a,c-diamide adenosyltransferase [Verrucomicrobiae bacterium]